MKKRGLLFSAFSMLMVSVIALSGATYAWFVSTQAPIVEEIEVSVISPARLKIGTNPSEDVGDYYTVISNNMWFGNKLITEDERDDQAYDEYFYPGLYHNPIDMDAVTPTLDSGKIVIKDASTVAASGTVAEKAGLPLTYDTSKTDPSTEAKVVASNGYYIDLRSYEGVQSNNYLAFDLYFLNETNIVNGTGSLAVSLDVRSTVQTYFSSMKADSLKLADNTELQEMLMYSLRAAFIISYGNNDGSAPDDVIFYEPNDTIPDDSGASYLPTDVVNVFDEAFFNYSMKQAPASATTPALQADYAKENTNAAGDKVDPKVPNDNTATRWKWPISENGSRKLPDTNPGANVGYQWPYNNGTAIGANAYEDNAAGDTYGNKYYKQSLVRAGSGRIPLFTSEPCLKAHDTLPDTLVIDQTKVVNMRVIVWMEGWDRESCTLVAGGSFVNALQFYSANV